jgi:hypothetical protein
VTAASENAETPLRIGIGDAFSLRDGERPRFYQSDLRHADFAVQLLAVQQPQPAKPGAAQIAVVAAQRIDGLWQWMDLAPDTKNAIATMLTGAPEPPPLGEWLEMHLSRVSGGAA